MEAANKLGYFFLGVGLGTAAGLLLAPQPGAEARNYLRSKTQEGTDYVKNQGQELVNSATETVKRGKQTLGTGMKNLSDAVDVGKRAYRDAVESAPTSV